MARQRDDPTPIVRLRQELTAVFSSRGFEPVASAPTWSGKYNILEWRRSGWKEDIVRLGWRKGLFAKYFLTAEWTVPGPSRSPVLAAGLNPGYSRRKLTDGSFPASVPLLGDVLLERWCREVVADLGHALDWLDTCSTMEGALSELSRPDRNGPAEGTDVHAHIVKFVREHA